MDSGSSPVAKDFCSKSPFAHLYKRKGANWKAEIRKNVNRRLRDSRNNLIDRFRLMNVQEKQVFLNNVIKEELNKQCDKQISAEELDEAIKEYEEFRQELLQQELDDMLKAEHDFILAEISHYFDSDDVYCPLCQKCALSFPDLYSFCCNRCGFTIRLSQQVSSASDLRTNFETIFSKHSENGCSYQLNVSVQNDNMTFECSKCTFFLKLF